MNKFPIILSLAAIGAFQVDVQAKKLSEYNVIYILADDLGYGDLGCYGQKKIKTPNIDRLAGQGMMFTQHYAGCAVSAPSRSSLMTGQHTGHTPIRGNRGGGMGREGQQPLPADTFTIAEMFKKAGYSTGAFGKWGLGYPGSEGDPINQGFDEFFGYNCQALAHKYYPLHLWHNRDKIVLEGNDGTHKETYSQDLIHRQAIKFIEDNRDGKFFAFLPYVLPHAEIIVPEDSILWSYRGLFEEQPYVGSRGSDYGPDINFSKYCSQSEPRTQFAAMVTRLDSYVGEIMTLTEQLGIADHTIIILTSDNGPHTEGGGDPAFFNSSGPMRGIKRDLYEGGIRVPMIAHCKSAIPGGMISEHISAFWDIMPTFAQMTGVKIGKNIDGLSMLPTLTDKGRQKNHEYLYWEFHELGGRMAVRMGNWKGVKLNVLKDADAKIELYDLSKDIHEDSNIAAQNPLIIEKLEKIMNSARVPSPIFKFKLPQH